MDTGVGLEITDTQIWVALGAIGTALTGAIAVLWNAYIKANDERFKALEKYNFELRELQKDTTNAINNSAMAMNGLKDVFNK